jgi:HEAT repeat protein
MSLGSLVGKDTKVDAALEKSLATIASSLGADVAAHLDDRDAKVRAVALSVAAKIDAPKVDDAIVEAFGDQAGLVRRAAMRAVVAVGARRGKVSDPLRKALVKSLSGDDWEDRQAAVHAIGAIGGEADALIGALGDDNAFVREAAAIVLGQQKAKGAVDALLTATEDDTWNVRAAAATALRAIGDGRAKQRLAELAADDPQDEVRIAAGGK